MHFIFCITNVSKHRVQWLRLIFQWGFLVILNEFSVTFEEFLWFDFDCNQIFRPHPDLCVCKIGNYDCVWSYKTFLVKTSVIFQHFCWKYRKKNFFLFQAVSHCFSQNPIIIWKYRKPTLKVLLRSKRI